MCLQTRYFHTAECANGTEKIFNVSRVMKFDRCYGFSFFCCFHRFLRIFFIIFLALTLTHSPKR